MVIETMIEWMNERRNAMMSRYSLILLGNGNDNQLRLNACMLAPAPPPPPRPDHQWSARTMSSKEAGGEVK